MKEIFDVLTTPVNKMRLIMVFSYLMAFAFFVMSIADYTLSLSPAVITLSIDSGFIQVDNYQAGSSVYYLIWYGLFWRLMNWSSDRLDAIESEHSSISKIVVID